MPAPILRDFTDGDWQAFSGADSASPKIAYLEAGELTVVVIADGRVLELIVEDEVGCGAVPFRGELRNAADAEELGNAICIGRFNLYEGEGAAFRLEHPNKPDLFIDDSLECLHDFQRDHVAGALRDLQKAPEPLAPTSRPAALDSPLGKVMVPEDDHAVPAAVAAAYDALVVLTYDGQPARAALLQADPKALAQADAARGRLVRDFDLPVHQPRSAWEVR